MSAAKQNLHRVLFVTDSWKTLDHANDSSLRLMECSLDQGIEVWWGCYYDLGMFHNQTRIHCMQVSKMNEPKAPQGVHFLQPEHRAVTDFHQIHFRTDPPVDLTYIQRLQLLQFGTMGTGTELINPAASILTGSEKLNGLRRGFFPPSIISSHVNELMDFIRDEKDVVLKPLHTAQSRGIRRIRADTDSLLEIRQFLFFELRETDCPILLQKFLPEIENGEIRLWFVDGELLQILRKKPAKDDYRVDIDRGSPLETAQITNDLMKKAAKVSEILIEDKIRLAAVDFIGEYITDFNITSPGLIRQMERIYGQPYGPEIIRALRHPFRHTRIRSIT